MITIGNFTGKLGNQLFQITAAYTHAKENGVEFLCPEWKYQKYFKLKHKTYQGEPIQQFYSEPGFHYTPIPFKDNTALNGYFQSEKYFNQLKDESGKLKVFDLFEFDKYWCGYDLIDPILRSRTNDFCSVHIRRGDYLNYPEHHPVVSIDYYKKAMLDVKYRTGCFCFVIFSDDIEWCKSVFSDNYFPDNGFIILYSEHGMDCQEIFDLIQMSICQHNIIANSTFSWWGAYLNQNPDKIVISPSKDKWHGPAYAHWNHDDIIPESWIQI